MPNGGTGGSTNEPAASAKASTTSWGRSCRPTTPPRPRRRARTRRDDLGNLAPTTGAGGAGSQAAAGTLSTVVGAAVDQVTAKASEAFTGRAELSVKVDAGPMLLVTIERIVKQGFEGLNTTGIGSTGRTDTNVDPHR